MGENVVNGVRSNEVRLYIYILENGETIGEKSGRIVWRIRQNYDFFTAINISLIKFFPLFLKFKHVTTQYANYITLFLTVRLNSQHSTRI